MSGLERKIVGADPGAGGVGAEDAWGVRGESGSAARVRCVRFVRLPGVFRGDESHAGKFRTRAVLTLFPTLHVSLQSGERRLPVAPFQPSLQPAGLIRRPHLRQGHREAIKAAPPPACGRLGRKERAKQAS